MILHVIDPTKNAAATFPLTVDPGVVLRLVPCTIFLAGEASFGRLRTAFVATEEMFSVPVEVFAKVATSREDCLR